MSLRTVRSVGMLVAAVFLFSHFVPAGLPARNTLLAARGAGARAPLDVVYSQPPSSSGGLLPSSLRDPGGSNLDRWAWDDFRFAVPTSITEIRWTGGYDPSWAGAGGRVAAFTLGIYGSIPSGGEPDLSVPPVNYELSSNAGETPGPILGGVQMYEYSFALPTAFQAAGGTKYWVQIEAYQGGASPDWGLTKGTGGDGMYFRRVVGEKNVYERAAGDATFMLLGVQNINARVYLPMVARW